MSSNRAEYKKRTQQRQTVIFGAILGVLALLLIWASLVWSGLIPFFFNREFTRPEEATSLVCPVADTPLETTMITASVFNSTNRSGLAGSVATSLTAAGVSISETANWGGTSFTDPIRIFVGPQGVTAGYTMRAFFPEAQVHIDPNITGEIVEVVLGEGYSNLVAQPSAEDFQAAMAPIPGCTEITARD